MKRIRRIKNLEKRVANLETSLIEKNATVTWLTNQVHFQHASIRRMESKLYPMYDEYHHQKKFVKNLEGP